ncbi:MAG: DUF2911 domain-containing protein, partial [Acidobacteriota bacterium]|nr:DUF2911 domain-containing protein [Acidobacteriota bacterium]
RPRSPAGRSATQVGGGYYDGQLGYVGGQWIEITYGRPIRRGRDIFSPDDFVEHLNDGAPVWRAGANVSTHLINDVALELGGTVIPAGDYTVFIELGRNEWTLIISAYGALRSDTDRGGAPALFGAFEYTPDRDLVRVPMNLETLSHRYDQLRWEFVDITPTTGRLALIWDNQMASVPFLVSQP